MKSIALCLFVCSGIFGTANSTPDQEVLQKIQQASEASRAYEYTATLSRWRRLTNSPGFFSATNWADRKLKKTGLDVSAEFYHFGTSWSWSKQRATLIKPRYKQLNSLPVPWSPSGTAHGELAYCPLEQDIEKWFAAHAGTLRGKIVLFERPRPKPDKKPEPQTFTQEQLRELDAQRLPPLMLRNSKNLPVFKNRAEQSEFTAKATIEELETLGRLYDAYYKKVYAFLKQEGVVGLVYSSENEWAIVPRNYSSRLPTEPIPPVPGVVIAASVYRELTAKLLAREPASMELAVQSRYHGNPNFSFNITASLLGKGSEEVLMTAHIDSLNGPGATDNATGVAVAMEALRLLKTLNLPLKRTVKLVLFSGEEQFQLGSRSYARKHAGDGIFCVFNLDGGAGKIRGLVLEDNPQARPLAEQWLNPLRPLGTTAIVDRDEYWNRGDHAPLNAVGIPAFSFLQDELESSLIAHSNRDTMEKVTAESLRQQVTAVAWLLYKAATEDKPIPRKKHIPLPAK